MDPRRPRLSDRSVAVREPSKPPTRPPSRTPRVPAAATAPRPPRYRPLCVSLPLADVQDRDPLAALQHVPQGPRVDGLLRHYRLPVLSISTGIPPLQQRLHHPHHSADGDHDTDWDLEPLQCRVGLFTRVRGRGLLRSSHVRSSQKFACLASCVVHSPLGLVTFAVTLRRRCCCRVAS